MFFDVLFLCSYFVYCIDISCSVGGRSAGKHSAAYNNNLWVTVVNKCLLGAIQSLLNSATLQEQA